MFTLNENTQLKGSVQMLNSAEGSAETLNLKHLKCLFNLNELLKHCP